MGCGGEGRAGGEQVEVAGGDGVKEKGWTHRDSIRGFCIMPVLVFCVFECLSVYSCACEKRK